MTLHSIPVYPKSDKRPGIMQAELAQLFAGIPATVAPYQAPHIEEAITLYELGLNVFPMPLAKKHDYPWKALRFVRLHPDDLVSVFDFRCNVAVMTGRTSENLFIIDCEDAAEYARQGEHLRARNIPLWALRSGGSRGGGHYYLRCADGEVANILPDKARAQHLGNLEIRGNRCYALTAPSIHPETGEPYRWDVREGETPPTVPLSALDWLPLELSTNKRTNRNPRKSYGRAAFEREITTLANTPEGGRNDQLNRSAFALGQLVAGGALDYTETETALTHTGYTIGLTGEEIRATVRSGLESGMAEPRSAKNTHGEERQKALAWIAAQSWHGQTGTTRRAVALALAERAQYASNTRFRASVRELAELARVSTHTVTARLEELTAAGFVQPAGSDQTSGARLWALGASAQVLNIATLYTLDSSSVAKFSYEPCDVFISDASERGALGKNGALVYATLRELEDPIMPAALARETGLTRNQVQYALTVLREKSPPEMPLIERLPAGYIANYIDDTWLDSLVAERHGTLGKGAERRAGFERERQARARDRFLEAIHREKVRIGYIYATHTSTREPVPDSDGGDVLTLVYTVYERNKPTGEEVRVCVTEERFITEHKLSTPMLFRLGQMWARNVGAPMHGGACNDSTTEALVRRGLCEPVPHPRHPRITAQWALTETAAAIGAGALEVFVRGQS